VRNTFLRVELSPTDESHLVCIACGRFNCDLAIVVGGGSLESQTGLHKKCVATVKAKVRRGLG